VNWLIREAQNIASVRFSPQRRSGTKYWYCTVANDSFDCFRLFSFFSTDYPRYRTIESCGVMSAIQSRTSSDAFGAICGIAASNTI
jgi:hypothetical protein